MAQTSERMMVDCSVVVKWRITAEDHADRAEELFFDWQEQAVEICAPNLLQSEIRIFINIGSYFCCLFDPYML